jgi:hypothetical protein
MALAALSTVGVLAMAEGCGPGDTRYYCDSTGCYNCDGYGCHNVPAPPTATCTGNATCTQGQICTSAGCETSCAGDTDCAQGTVCKDNFCVAPTSTTTVNPLACTTNADCVNGDVCVGTGTWAQCVPQSSACSYSSQCASGTVCADGECLTDCSMGQACPTGTACTKGVCEPNATQCTSNAQCSGSTPVCADGTCEAQCNPQVTPTTCATGDYCEQIGTDPTVGACVVDTRPQPDCGGAGQQCLSTQTCLDGFCRYTCTYSGSSTNVSMQCELIDTRISYCAKDGTCRDQQEANAQCLDASDCTAGQLCVSNQCE